MATEKPRITITLEPAQHEVLKRLSALQGGSMSKIVSEFLGEITPILEKVADSLESAKRASADARARFVRAAEVAEEELRPLADFARSQFDLYAEELQRLGDQAQAGEGCDGRPVQHSPALEGSPQPVITGATEVKRRVGKGKGEAGRVASKPMPRKASRDDLEGMAWWNALTEWERSSWCQKAGTAVAAEAWAYFKSTSLGAK